jgi:uncharacterized DUF497 family protein
LNGLDFADAKEVLESRYRLDIEVMQGNEFRIQSISYALGFLAVLRVIHTQRDKATGIIRFSRASLRERGGGLIVSGSKKNTMTRNAA